MIPLKLSVRNFMCYRENVTPLDFTGIHLACLCGDNGHGKSALLDAITWALWGRSRASTDDELIYIGANEMEVEFDFQLGKNVYRVLRKRQKRKSGSIPSLEFFVRDGDSFRSISGNTIPETEKKIIEILRMDYKTFINSAFLMQGRADEFTVKPPGERKQILADILGLSMYDQLEDMAKERAKTYEMQRKTLEAEIQAIDVELANEPRYQEELAIAQANSARLMAELKQAEEILRSLREQKSALDAKAKQLEDLEARIARTRRDIANAESQAEAHRQRIVTYEVILARRAEIEEGYAALKQISAENDNLNRLLARVTQLQVEERQIERLIEGERAHLMAEQRVLQERIGELTARQEKAINSENELVELQAKLSVLSTLETDLKSLHQQLLEMSGRVAALRQSNETLRNEMYILRGKLDALAGVTHCPLCNTPLSDAERERVRGNYQEEGSRKGEVYRQNEAEIKFLEQEMAQIKTEIAEREAQLRERPALQRREAALAQLVADARAAAAQARTLQERLTNVTSRLERGEFAQADQARLRDVRQQIATLGYDAAYHEQVRARLDSLRHFEDEKSKLETALHLVHSERAALQRLEASVAAWRKDIQADEEQATALRMALADLPTISANLKAQEGIVSTLQTRERYAREALGVARQKLDHCAYLHKQRQEKAAAEKEARQERSLYEELAVAFGKKGIQAMIIEQAIPEIEQEANALLARMTDNRMHVKFETQRGTKHGETIETLDIKLSDEIGIRNYEMYSGGEAFRANFAIRIALSKLLARRAGASLQTLIIDEGFGTQDSRGRERLVEVINSIADDFEKILVITHIDELKDAFPVRIDVTKTAEGSQITVT